MKNIFRFFGLCVLTSVFLCACVTSNQGNSQHIEHVVWEIIKFYDAEYPMEISQNQYDVSISDLNAHLYMSFDAGRVYIAMMAIGQTFQAGPFKISVFDDGLSADLRYRIVSDRVLELIDNTGSVEICQYKIKNGHFLLLDNNQNEMIKAKKVKTPSVDAVIHALPVG